MTRVELPKIVLLRAPLQMAAFGMAGMAVFSVPLMIGRGVGLIEFHPENIPGEMIGSWIGIHSPAIDVIAYLLMGAILGLVYRSLFRIFNHADWNFGLPIGVIQWCFAGIVIGLLQKFLPDSPLLLPVQAPDDSLSGLFDFFFLFALNASYGVFIGYVSAAPLPIPKSEEKTDLEIRIMNKIQKAA